MLLATRDRDLDRPVDGRPVQDDTDRPVGFMPFQTPVRGHAFAGRPPGARAPRPGQPAWLERERGNPRDPWAVAVWTRDIATGQAWRIGYLERAVGARIGPRLDVGVDVEASLTGWWEAPGGRWRRPVVGLRPAR